ncbi:urease accessory protein D-like isoform X2 [Centruroides sculpturatus]|uniref:urease accessory protein D-like isoform X2 n=1 Tax=Centruroides sculpturatus TaxID=218467 RepID=UPI000C6ECC42|nr:urease accessory protein D-like isoform X2 [Centruroides sculpturatus]
MDRVVSGQVVVESCHNKCHLKDCPYLPSEVIQCVYKYPLKIIIPKYAATGCCKWIYSLNYGGGFVSGDSFKIDVIVKEKCSVLWTTQSFTKVYNCKRNKECKQDIIYTVNSESLLCILPEPVVCFKDAKYKQYQEVNLDYDGNLVLLDWFTSGRKAHGEHWDFEKYQSTTIIKLAGKIILKENICLQDTPFLLKRDANKNYALFGICIIIGSKFSKLIMYLLQKLQLREPYDVFSQSKLDSFKVVFEITLLTTNFLALLVPEPCQTNQDHIIATQ